MQRQTRGLPALQVARSAHWTLIALAAGYPQGAEEPSPGRYRTLIEGLESFVANRVGVTRSSTGGDTRSTRGMRGPT
jgi:hypothetical protein